jgi:cardiolipin synthase A/B
MRDGKRAHIDRWHVRIDDGAPAAHSLGVQPHDVLLQALAACHFAIAGLVVVDLLRQHRTPAATVAWMSVLLLLPYAGIALYFFAGAPRKHGVQLSHYLQAHTRAPPRLAPIAARSVESLLFALGLPAATPGNRVALCIENEAAATELLRVIDNAERRLFLSVFSFENDVSGKQVLDRLAARATAGVDVRVLIDGYGSKEMRAEPIARLRACGARVAHFRPFFWSIARRGASNYRNHRKMIVADGRTAWLGGRNIADKYLTSFADGTHWADLSLVVTGPAAAILESVCLSDWHEASGKRVDTNATESLESNMPGESTVQVLPAGPDIEDDTLHAVLMASAMGATRRIWIASPFFVPDDALQAVLRLAARRGVDVRVITPRRSNQRFADWVRGSYLRDLQDAGARIELFERRMLHAKAIVVDDHLAIVGSANLDMRSLFTNHEICVVLYSRANIEAAASCIESYSIESSTGVPPVNFAGTVVSGALRIAAPFV